MKPSQVKKPAKNPYITADWSGPTPHVDGRQIALHQMRDRAVDQALALEHAQTGERGRHDVDREVPAGAAHVGLGARNLAFDGFAQRIDHVALKISRV